jgi:hypothetical protein
MERVMEMQWFLLSSDEMDLRSDVSLSSLSSLFVEALL